MTSKKFVPMLLAASVLVSGFTGAFVYTPSALGITSVDELSDVERSSWAFDALRDLVEKYNVIEGYPDKTFRGNHKATRYEMAAALNALIRHVGKDIARLGTEKADKEDLAKLAKLQEEFKAELAALQARTDALEARAAKIEAKNEEQDNRLTVLEKLKIYGDVTLGGFADMGGRGGNGSPFLGQGHFAQGYNAAGNNIAQNGTGMSEGFSDAISALGRVRVNIDYPIVEDLDGEGAIGEGTIHTRLVGAYGRMSPMLSGADFAKVGTGSGMLSGITRITGDASMFNEGVRTSTNQTAMGGVFGRNAISGSNTRANIYLESAYYTQEYRSGIPILTDLLPGVDLLPDDENWKMSLKTKFGLVPWREIFQKSPYTGDETQQFQNTALVNNSAIPVNVIGPTLAFEWHQGLGEWHSLDVKTALSAIDVSDAMSAFAVTYEGSVNYNWGWLSDWLDHPGNIYAGGWWLNGRGGSNGMIQSQTPFNARSVGGINDMVAGMAASPVNTLIQAGGPAASANLANLNAFMGLPAGSLATPATLAAGLGITTAQLANPNTVLPTATINAINAAGGFWNAVNPLPAGTTLGAYYDEFYRQAAGFGLVGARTQGVLPAGDTSTGTLDDNDNAYGFYCGLNQELHRGAGVFFSYGVADTGPQSLLVSALQNGTGRNAIFHGAGGMFGNGRFIHGVKQSMNVGLEIPMKALHLPWREKDVFGFGYAQLKPNDAYGGAYSGTQNAWGSVAAPNGIWVPNRIVGTAPAPVFNAAPQTYNQWNGVGTYQRSYMEHIMEMYYKVHINDRFTITPSVQFIIDRLGDPSNDLMTVFGLRSTFKF